MQTVVGYKKVVKTFRRKWREVYVPIYKDLGKAKTPNKTLKIDLKRET